MNERMLPEAFTERMSRQLGNELPLFLQCYNEPYLRGIRYNPLKVTEHPDLPPVLWARDAYELPADSDAGATVMHEAGAFYLQEPGAMLPAAVMDARPGERILDLCAAPGGKSTQLGCAMRGEGLLICNEPVPKRAKILSENIERMGISNAIVVSAYPDALAERMPGCFDGVQVDAPCSGEGMFRRHPETIGEWSPEMAAGCSGRQTEILNEAARLVRPGGRIVYSTCTMNPEENEGVIERFLKEHPEFTSEPFSLPGASAPDGMLTCYPHRMRAEGHFTAKLRRGGDAPRGEIAARPFPAPTKEQKALLRAFCGDAPEADAVFGETLVSCGEIPDLKGIKVLRVGLHLGEARGKLFIPDHAWSHAENPPCVERIGLNEKEALLYCAGETIPHGGKGWVLVCCRGLALGFGKISDGMIKNHYPKGLRKALTRA
ncbi:MAG: RsmB/NOP family class I SAM-dependent RNA methyltransferase [Clostridia bacterium]|nr:RsmB/NOP family class I SAM-dependent RNA methyltransferase [Clostridia bacterium]